MNGFPSYINSRQDLENLLADPTYKTQAVAYLQTLVDEEYGYTASGAWGICPNSGLSRLGITRAEAATMGATDRVVAEPAFDATAYQAQAIAQLEAERDRRLYSTFRDSRGATWVVDDRGRKQLSDRLLLVMGGMSPASWEWTLANGAGVTMTPDSLKALCAELATWHDAHFVACRVAAGAITLETTRARIDAAEAAVAWPES